MDEQWTNIEESRYGQEILRYKADRAALDEITHALGSLPDTLIIHSDLKSRCLAVLIPVFVQQVQPQIDSLPDESAFYFEPTHDLEQPRITRVKDTPFETHREECREILKKLKADLKEAHYHIDTWFVQEFGKIRLVEVHPIHGICDWSNTYNHLEDTIYQDYIMGYNALMQP
jgi:hypothetical protein